MSAQLAVVDTSTILLMVSPIDPKDLGRSARQARTEDVLREFGRDGVKFVVPAPVVTELGMFSDGDGRVIAEAVFGRLGGLRIESFDLVAAETAARMLRTTFKTRAPNDPRDVVKVDAMIAAIADALSARYLVTANERDMRKHLDAINSKVELIKNDAPRTVGQLRLIDHVAKQDAAETVTKTEKK